MKGLNIKAFFGFIKEGLKSYGSLWSRPESALMARVALLGIVFSIFTLALTVRQIVQQLHPHHIELEHESENEEVHAHSEHKEGGGEGIDLMGNVSPFPKAVLKRQVGHIQPGNDLKDPEILEDRGLASLIKKEDVKIRMPYRFVEIQGINSSTKPNPEGAEGMLTSSVALEVDSLEGEQELKARMTEFSAMISAKVASIDKDELKSTSGKWKLKQDIFELINHHLKNGRVSDVLFTSFEVR